MSWKEHMAEEAYLPHGIKKKKERGKVWGLNIPFKSMLLMTSFPSTQMYLKVSFTSQ
jgi:hypothetical protein